MILRTFGTLRSFIPLLFSFVICVCLPVVKAKSDSRRREKYMLLIQVSLCYILKHLEDRKAWHVHIHYTWHDIILIFKLHRRTRLTPRSSIHSLKITMTSHPCNKYEHTTVSYLLSVNWNMICSRNLKSEGRTTKQLAYFAAKTSPKNTSSLLLSFHTPDQKLPANRVEVQLVISMRNWIALNRNHIPW